MPSQIVHRTVTSPGCRHRKRGTTTLSSPAHVCFFVTSLLLAHLNVWVTSANPGGHWSPNIISASATRVQMALFANSNMLVYSMSVIGIRTCCNHRSLYTTTENSVDHSLPLFLEVGQTAYYISTELSVTTETFGGRNLVCFRDCHTTAALLRKACSFPCERTTIRCKDNMGWIPTACGCETLGAGPLSSAEQPPSVYMILHIHTYIHTYARPTQAKKGLVLTSLLSLFLSRVSCHSASPRLGRLLLCPKPYASCPKPSNANVCTPYDICGISREYSPSDTPQKSAKSEKMSTG